MSLTNSLLSQLIGTAGAWFLYDFVTFPNGVFSGSIIANIVKSTGKEKIRKTAEWQLLLSALSLPGCIVGALIVNKLGRRNLSESFAISLAIWEDPDD